MIGKPSCATCANMKQEDDGQMYCHARPPFAQVLMSPKPNLLTHQMEIAQTVVAAWPPVNPSGYCTKDYDPLIAH